MRRKFNVDKIKEAIEICGGKNNLAQKINMSYVAVCDWATGKKTPSPESCFRIEKVTNGKVKAKDILPPYEFNYDNFNGNAA